MTIFHFLPFSWKLVWKHFNLIFSKEKNKSKFQFIDDFWLLASNRFYLGVFTSNFVIFVVFRLLFLFRIQWKQKKILKISIIQGNEHIQARSHSKKPANGDYLKRTPRNRQNSVFFIIFLYKFSFIFMFSYSGR